jgi:MoxR-like ATPase
MHAAQAHAFLCGFSFVPPDSVKTLAPYVLPHRILLDPHREHAGLSKRKLVEDILSEVPIPTMPHDKVKAAASE